MRSSLHCKRIGNTVPWPLHEEPSALHAAEEDLAACASLDASLTRMPTPGFQPRALYDGFKGEGAAASSTRGLGVVHWERDARGLPAACRRAWLEQAGVV